MDIRRSNAKHFLGFQKSGSSVLTQRNKVHVKGTRSERSPWPRDRPWCEEYLTNAEGVFAASSKSREATFDGRVDVLMSLRASPLGRARKKNKEVNDELWMNGPLFA